MRRAQLFGLAISVVFGARELRADEAEVTQTCIVAYERAGEQRKIFRDALRARDESARCAASCPSPLADECRAWLAEEEGKLARLELVTTVPAERELQIRLDGAVRGAETIELNAGPHELVVSVSGWPQHAESFVLAEGQAARREISFVDDPGDEGARVASFVLGGLGGASLLASGALAIVGHLTASDLRDSCAPDCAPGDVDVIEHEWIAAGVLAGVGAASLGVAGALFALGAPGDASGLRVTVGPAGLALSIDL